MNPKDPRLAALQRYADGIATREDVATVEQAILHDLDFRQLSVEYLHLDGALEQFAEFCEVAPVIRPMKRVTWALAAAAAVTVAALSLWLWTPAKAPVPANVPLAQVEVEVLELTEARIEGPNAGLRAHDRARLDSLELQSGQARLRLSSSVELTIFGPASLRFVDPMRARVLRGKINVDCSLQGRGFVLDTPVTRVVDLSTQFGVEARADGATDVMVFKGHVEVSDPQLAQPAAALEQGEAVRVATTHTVARLVNITGTLRPGEWSSEPPPTECNIVSVRDNFGSSEGFHFYRIVPHGLRAGVVAYSNRPHVWRAVDGQEFPPSLQNADVVQTFFGELRRPGYAIEVEVSRPVELFVLMRRRGTPQPWLTENFTQTGEELLLDESGGSPTPPRSPLYFDVWKRTVRQAGTITLGPVNRDSNNGPTGMYGIAAKPLSL